MTDDYLWELQHIVDTSKPTAPFQRVTVMNLLGHIAAVTAERDAALAQGQADHRAIHDALGWVHGWNGADLPSPWHGVVALIAKQDGWKTRVQELEREALKRTGEFDRDWTALRGENDTLRQQLQAMTTEREHYKQMGPSAKDAGWLEPPEAAMLRERVQALEKQVQEWALHADMHRQGRQNAEVRQRAAESRLAAIRQRAGDERRMAESLAPEKMSLVQRAIDRILGGVPERGDEQQAEAPTHAGREFILALGANILEPTTAEAFDTQRLWLNALPPQSRADAKANLSLLERRMGAMGRAAQLAVSALDALLGDSDLPSDDRPGVLAMQALRAALTDAPDVYTREEVDGVLRVVAHQGSAARMDEPLMQGMRISVMERLTAMRRTL